MICYFCSGYLLVLSTSNLFDGFVSEVEDYDYKSECKYKGLKVEGYLIPPEHIFLTDTIILSILKPLKIRKHLIHSGLDPNHPQHAPIGDRQHQNPNQNITNSHQLSTQRLILSLHIIYRPVHIRQAQRQDEIWNEQIDDRGYGLVVEEVLRVVMQEKYCEEKAVC